MPALAILPTRQAEGLSPEPEAAPWPRRVASPVARSTDWTALPEAAALLADCAAKPPATRTVEITDLSNFHTPLYVGDRVRRLGAIHRTEAARLFVACEAARIYDAFDAHCRRGVQQAIADALFHAALARSAACDARALAELG